MLIYRVGNLRGKEGKMMSLSPHEVSSAMMTQYLALTRYSPVVLIPNR